MLITLAVWVVVTVAAWGCGSRYFGRGGERSAVDVGVEIYFGLLAVCGAMLAAALVTGVSWWVGVVVIAPGLVFGTRRLVWRQVRMPLGAMGVLALFCATRVVDFYDTGLYHQQAVKWLARYGVVRGVALLNYRLGWSSAWFAGAAALNHGVLAGREAQIVGGMPFALMAVVSVAIVARGVDGLRAWTWVVFSGLAGGAMVAWGVEASLSADTMVWLLPLMIALAGAEEGFLIAALGCAVRLTCLPLLGFAGVVWALQRRRNWRVLGVACAVLLVVGTANYRASGCPAFPSAVGCSSGESSVGAAFAQAVSADIRSSTAKLDRHFAAFVAVALVASVLALVLRRREAFVLRCLGVSWSGILFMAVTGVRNPRFGLGCFCLPVAVAAGVVLDRVRWRVPGWVLVGAGACVAGFSLQRVDGLVMPLRMARENGDSTAMISRKFDQATELSVTKEMAGEVMIYRLPAGRDQCWDAELPCTRETVVEELRLRDAGEGLGGGFVSEGVRELK